MNACRAHVLRRAQLVALLAQYSNNRTFGRRGPSNWSRRNQTKPLWWGASASCRRAASWPRRRRTATKINARTHTHTHTHTRHPTSDWEVWERCRSHEKWKRVQRLDQRVWCLWVGSANHRQSSVIYRPCIDIADCARQFRVTAPKVMLAANKSATRAFHLVHAGRKGASLPVPVASTKSLPVWRSRFTFVSNFGLTTKNNRRCRIATTDDRAWQMDRVNHAPNVNFDQAVALSLSVWHGDNLRENWNHFDIEIARWFPMSPIHEIDCPISQAKASARNWTISEMIQYNLK